MSGGISFDTPDDMLAKPASDAGSVFRLYNNQSDAEQEPRGPTLVYRVDFTGPASGGVGPGTTVQLLGTGVGTVTEARLQYDDATDSLLTRVTLQIDPTKVEVVHRRSGSANDPVSAFGARIAKLVARGLRAQLTTASFLTGLKVISLDMVHDAPAGAHRTGRWLRPAAERQFHGSRRYSLQRQEHRASRRHGDRRT